MSMMDSDKVETMIAPPSPARRRAIQLVDSIKKGLFVIGTALLIFVCARNSIHWHIQNFWGASGNFWQKCWQGIHVNVFGENDLLIGVVGTLVVTIGTFWLANIGLVFLEVTGKPKALLKYKIQEDKKVPVDKEKLKKAVWLVIFNQTVLGIPFVYIAFHIMKWRGCTFRAEDLPTFHWTLFELIIFSLVEEIFFYYSHRMLHHRLIYKHIHKVHHEWTAPIGVISIYAHPVEHVFSNLIPPALGPIFMGSHLASAWMWFCIALLSTTVAHCGYHFPLLPSPEAHDYHHFKFNQNYGVLGVLDRLHGTDNQFRASKQYQRHILLLTLAPLTEQIPDSPKKKPE
ncbi:hypothetical protein ACJMK2_032551 [Sinanodonta woodiana]|uniref:Fatty acid hydroxylase domain-containing protein n=1 Tax=Sinanodonta woodiana TaxID=1069815 RepID=A0ABD3X662_SINWO